MTLVAPLAGIKVIEIGQAFAGPLAGVILADMGADVIKVEKPDGGDDARLWGPALADGASLFFHAMNRNKRSVTLDIKSASDIAALKRLTSDADILIQNLRPGIVDECGIGPDAMMSVNPRLICCSIWAFGYQGPLRLAPGFDPLLQAYAAVLTLTGRPDDPPTFCAPAINDKATGMWCVIDTSLFESAVTWVAGQLNHYRASGQVPQRHSTGSAIIAPYQVFETADRPMCIAAGNDRLFVKCAEVLGHREWASDPRFRINMERAANREALVALMQPVLLTQPRDVWMSALSAAGVPCAPVNDVAELSESEQLRAVDLMRALPGSGLDVVGLPISFDQQRPYPHSDSPRLGEHNEEVLS